MRTPSSRSLRRRLPMAGCLVLAAAALSGCTGGHSAHSSGDAPDVTAGPASCRWTGASPRPGGQTFTFVNHDYGAVRAVLTQPSTGGVWTDTGAVDAGASATMTVVLPSGQFQWRCISLQGPATTSAVRTTTGSGDGASPGKPLIPLTAQEDAAVVASYRGAISATMAQLAADTDALAAAVHGGNVATARARWLTAHLDYERLGAAYGTFGDLDAAIDGLPAGHADGTGDPAFTGFLRVEHDLWNGVTGSALAADVGTLLDDVHDLVATFPTMTINPTDIPLRAHEILEMTVQRDLSGRSDQGSGTALATARANVDGATTALTAIAAPLQRRDPDLLAAARTGLSGLAAQLDGLRAPEGGWPSPAQLAHAQRIALDARIQGLLEVLAPIPDVLQQAPSAAPD